MREAIYTGTLIGSLFLALSACIIHQNHGRLKGLAFAVIDQAQGVSAPRGMPTVTGGPYPFEPIGCIKDVEERSIKNKRTHGYGFF